MIGQQCQRALPGWSVSPSASQHWYTAHTTPSAPAGLPAVLIWFFLFEATTCQEAALPYPLAPVDVPPHRHRCHQDRLSQDGPPGAGVPGDRPLTPPPLLHKHPTPSATQAPHPLCYTNPSPPLATLTLPHPLLVLAWAVLVNEVLALAAVLLLQLPPSPQPSWHRVLLCRAPSSEGGQLMQDEVLPCSPRAGG